MSYINYRLHQILMRIQTEKTTRINGYRMHFGWCFFSNLTSFFIAARINQHIYNIKSLDDTPEKKFISMISAQHCSPFKFSREKKNDLLDFSIKTKLYQGHKMQKNISLIV